jgi:Ser/Thr protein kinase RdoA (MazF antagonist)
MQIVRSTIAGDEILHLIIDKYGFAKDNALCLLEYRGVNDVYKYTHGSTSTFLKIYSRKESDRDSIGAEIEVVNYLRRSGLLVANPIPMINGEFILPLETPEGARYGVLFSEAEGIPLDNDALDKKTVLAIGKMISTMHSMLDMMPTSPTRWKLDDKIFLDLSLQILEQYSRFNSKIDMLFIRDVVEELKCQIQMNRANWNWGICHGDIYTGNICQNERDELTIFDFDFCGLGWRAYDVASFLGLFGRGFHADVIDKRKSRLDTFLRGYEFAGALSNSEVEAIYKVFVPFRRIFNMGYLYDSLLNVWGDRLRHEQINHDLALLKEWVNHYW